MMDNHVHHLKGIPWTDQLVYVPLSMVLGGHDRRQGALGPLWLSYATDDKEFMAQTHRKFLKLNVSIAEPWLSYAIRDKCFYGDMFYDWQERETNASEPYNQHPLHLTGATSVVGNVRMHSFPQGAQQEEESHGSQLLT